MVYVDEIVEYPPEMIKGVVRKNGTRWAHLWCDEGSEDTMHRMALTIGLKRKYFQNKRNFPHCDLTPNKRASAIKAGAQVNSLREWIQKQDRIF